MTITITDEGVIMDVYGCKADIHQPHLGTAGMMFDEWAEWIVTDEETTDIDRKRP
jgi:hypothetical protein